MGMEGTVYIPGIADMLILNCVVVYFIIVVLIYMQAIVSTEGDKIVSTSDHSQCQGGSDDQVPDTMTKKCSRLVSPTVLVIHEQNQVLHVGTQNFCKCLNSTQSLF